MNENSDTEPPLSREEAKDLLRRDFENLCRKVERGQSLGAGERALVASVGESGSPTVISSPAFVAKQTDLARALGVTRRTVHAWRKQGAPKPASNGSWDVVAWKTWMQSHGKKGGDGGDDCSNAQLRARRLLLQNEKLSFEIGIQKGEYLHVDAVCSVAVRSSIEVKKILLAMPTALAPQLAGLSEGEIHDRLIAAMHEALEPLDRHRF